MNTEQNVVIYRLNEQERLALVNSRPKSYLQFLKREPQFVPFNNVTIALEAKRNHTERSVRYGE